MQTSISVAARILVALLLMAISTADSAASLYERIGAEVLNAVVDEYVDVLRADPETQRSFHKSDAKRVKKMLALQLCDLTGGPCKYDGDSMRDVHAGHGINHREFYRGVELLREVLVRHGVPLRERNELLALLAPMKRDVIDR